ncbi:uncharacterized protein [Cherax quadricarinatus]|uniref:uncharacterized protein isoform X3 n=1 Tax=Cherax quadricarinatus TaxID=27406 RepID=UPI0023792F54|nr:uncharacterized protein LOC128687988 isoform X3 [Cherax quadricarinatus]
MMKTLLFVVAFTALLSTGSLASVHQATCYTDHNKGGSYQTFTDYIPDLLTYNFDNQISSVTVTGIWIFYERANFAAGTSVYWVHGFNYFTNFDGGYDNAFSSLRYGGSTSCLNCDTWTVYLDLYFSGSEYYGTTDTASLGSLQKEVSSILLTGISPWTFYNGPSYTGSSVCLYPSTDQDTDGAGSVLNIGLYPDVSTDNNTLPRRDISGDIRQQHPVSAQGMLVKEGHQSSSRGQGTRQGTQRCLGSLQGHR